MVGVAGRSKGCKTCRERKIKCDEGRPGCIRCQKIGKTCPGYARNFPIIPCHPKGQQQPPLITWEENPTTTISSSKLDIVIGNGSGTRRKPGLSARARARARSDSPNNHDIFGATFEVAPTVIQNTPLNVTIPFDKTDAYVKIYVQDFVHVSAPYRSVFKTAMVPYRFGHIYATHFRTGDSPDTRKALEDAFAACAATYFALKEGDVNSKIQGHILYLKLLRQLKKDVKSGLANSDPAVFLYSCMMAAHYEILTSTSAATWLYHLSALGNLIQSLGPHSFNDPLAGAILEVVRPYILFNGLMQLKPSFLEREEWKTIPIQAYPGGLSPWNRLLDLCTPLPRVLSLGKACVDNFTRVNASKHMELCLSVVNSLRIWREDWNKGFGKEPHTYSVSSSQVPHFSAIDEQGPLFDTILWFQSISICTTVYYWDTYMIIIANHMRRFIPWYELYFGELDTLTIQLRQLVATFDIPMLCREVARSIDFQRCPEFMFGSTGLFFGALVAYEIIDPTSRLARFLEIAIINSPLLRRTGVTGALDLLKAWYGPDEPTEADIMIVQQEKLNQMFLAEPLESLVALS